MPESIPETFYLLVLAGFAGGFLLAWLWQRGAINGLGAENEILRQEVEDSQKFQEEFFKAREELSALNERLEQQKHAYEEKLALLTGAREELTRDFENLANRIFDDKQEKFHQQSRLQLDSVVNPLREQLGSFHKKVEDVYDKESKERSSLIGEIRTLKDLNQRIGEEALNLTNALKGDNKAQGNWGELKLERILEESGLENGLEYETQVSMRTEEGDRRNPDVVVHLPEDKDIIIDSKVALVDYVRYTEADTDEEKALALKAHINAIKVHIKGLSGKSYDNLEGLRSLDFVLMFIPIEAAFMAAFEQDDSVFRDAFDMGIIVVGPTTLLATLKTVQSIWRYEKQNKNAETIATEAGRLYDQFARVLESFEEVGKHIDKAQGSWGEAVKRLSTGRGNLVGRVEKLQELGAKTKKQIPDRFRDDDVSQIEDKKDD